MLRVFADVCDNAGDRKLEAHMLESDPEILSELVTLSSSDLIKASVPLDRGARSSLPRASLLASVDEDPAAIPEAPRLQLEVDGTPADWDTKESWIRVPAELRTYHQSGSA